MRTWQGMARSSSSRYVITDILFLALGLTREEELWVLVNVRLYNHNDVYLGSSTFVSWHNRFTHSACTNSNTQCQSYRDASWWPCDTSLWVSLLLVWSSSYSSLVG